MFLDPRRHGEDIGVEDDVLGREADLVDEDAIGAGADLDLARGRIGLAHLVERHDDDGSPIAQAFDRLFAELGLAHLHRDRIDDRLALDAFQPRLDHLPFGAVDHHGHPGDVGLGRDQVQEGDHGRLRVEQALVHIDVDDRGPGLDLLTRDSEGGGVVAVDDQLLEFGRAGDIGPLTDVDEGGSHRNTPLIPAKAGTQCFREARCPGLMSERTRSDRSPKELGPRFRGDERKFDGITPPAQTVPAPIAASPRAAPVSPASAVSTPPPPCAGCAPASCRSSRRRC